MVEPADPPPGVVQHATSIVPVAVVATISTTANAVRLTRRAAGWAERQVLGALRTRLDAVSAPPAPEPVRVLALSAPARPESLRSKLTGLLDQALVLGSAESRETLFNKLLDQIVPDEARILGALSDGSRVTLVHVRSRRGREPVLENASLVGKSANLSLAHLTPMYLTHLHSLGLLEIGPEDSALKQEYEILAADPGVLRAIRTATRGPIHAVVERQTVRLSGLGLELWQAATRDFEP